MQESYLDTFKEYFFNVEENLEIKEATEQISSLLDSLVEKFGELLNEFMYDESESDKPVKEVIISFIRKIIEQLDAINALCSICSFDSAQIILRSFIENIVSLEFILKDDTSKRAASYFLNRYYKEIEIADRCSEHISEETKNVVEQERKSLSLLSKNDTFKEVYESRKKKLKNKKYIEWYSYCSEINSFKQLMKEVNLGEYYDIIYGGLSLETHALTSTTALKSIKGNRQIRRVRGPVKDTSTFEYTCDFAISALTAIYTYLKDGENEKAEFNNFCKKFYEKYNKTINYFNEAYEHLKLI